MKNHNPFKPDFKRIQSLLAAALWMTVATASAQMTETFSFTNLNRVIPDGDSSGMAEFRTVTSSVVDISKVTVKLRVAGNYNGDLYGYLVHSNGLSVLLNRPGRTTGSPSGYDDSGLDITLDDDAANDIHTYRESVTPAAGVPLTGAWQPDAREVDPSIVTNASARTGFLGDFHGQNGSGEWILFLLDAESGGTNALLSWELEITGKTSPMLTWVDPASITYGTALGGPELNASAGVSGSFDYSPTAGTLLSAGSNQVLSVTFTPDDTNSYVTANATVSIDVLHAPLTIAAEDAGKFYGEADPVFTVGYAGFIPGEDPSALGGALALNRAAGEAAGPYVITPSGLTSANYTITFNTGTLTIGKASSSGLVDASANPAIPGDPLVLSLAVNAVAPGAGIPTGTVDFHTNGVPFVAGVTLVGGVAALTNSSLPAGDYAISASYGGDSNFEGTSASLAGTLVMNTPPEASPDTIRRYAFAGVKVQSTTLLTNDFDADGHTIALDSVGVSSTAGGTVLLTNDWVHYTPPSGFTNVDSYTYVILDGHGGSTTGTVSVVVQDDSGITDNVSIEALGDGDYRIRFMGVPGRTYEVQYSDGIDPANWQILATVTADEQGRGETIDTPPVGGPGRFYRTARGTTP